MAQPKRLYNLHQTEPVALPPTLEELAIQHEMEMHLGDWLSLLSALPGLRRLSDDAGVRLGDGDRASGSGAVYRSQELCLGSNSLGDGALVWAELADLPGLGCLRIHANELRFFPPSIRCLKGLTTLRLDHDSIEEIPEWLGELEQLEELGLSVVLLRDLPPSILQVPLKRLFVDVPDDV